MLFGPRCPVVPSVGSERGMPPRNDWHDMCQPETGWQDEKGCHDDVKLEE